MDIELNESWISGKYKNGEINTAYSTVSVTDPEWFFQGHEAEEVINTIHQFWLNNDVTSEQAFDWYVNTYL